VRVIQVPIYLGPGDGLWNLPYHAVLRAFDLTQLVAGMIPKTLFR
jgi:hypothetical protein